MEWIDASNTVLKRPAEHLEDLAAELWQFIQGEQAVWCARDILVGIGTCPPLISPTFAMR